VCLTTGHLLKDPDAAAEAGNKPEPVPNDTDAILELIDEGSSVGETVRRQASKAASSPSIPALIAGGIGLAYLYRKLRKKT
jgi:threonine synthase